MTSTPDYFVLFADMLGFKQLVLRHRVPYPENLEFRGRIFARPERPNPPAATGNPLGEAFRTFHRTANDCLNYKVWRAPVSVIIFSDSLFLATTNAEDCMEFTETMMIKGLNRDMPLRMGIGLGSFVRYGFAYEDDPNVKYSSAQFFGSGVVHAVDAEGSIKGIRVAVHPSAVAALTPNHPTRLVALPASQITANASHELNYIPQYPDPVGDLQFHGEIRGKVHELAAAAPKEPRVQIQYTEAISALDRMAAVLERRR